MKTIDQETVLLPVVVADSVISELALYLHNRGIELPVSDGLAEKLADKAERCYRVNPAFRKRIRSEANYGRAGLEWLRTFMRHWLSAEFPHGSNIHRNLPEGFCIGKPAR